MKIIETTGELLMLNLTSKEIQVWLDGSEDRMGNSIYVDGVENLNDLSNSFHTVEEATKFIESKVDAVLMDMVKYAKNLEDLKTMDPTQAVGYYMKTKDGEKTFFRTWDYIQKRAEYIFDNYQES